MSAGRPLRIVRALPFFSARHGGPVGQARATSRGLAARGHRVVVVTTDLGERDDDRGAREEVDGCTVVRLPARGLSAVPPYALPRGGRAALASAAADADVLVGNVGLTLWNARLAALASERGLPFVYNAEGALDPVRLAEKRLRKLAFVRCCERGVLARATALQAVTAAERADLIALGADPARVHVIPNGVEAPRDLPTRAAARAALGLPADAVIVLFLGRVHPLKGLDLALAAAAPLLRTDGGRRFWVVGPDDGALADARRRARELGVGAQVAFAGAVAGDERWRWLAAADVFALTSRSEGLPNAALEAAAAGLPLWLSTACHLPEVAAGNAGGVAEPEILPLRAALQPLLDDAALRRRRGENARAMVREHFALERVVDRLEALYMGLCAARTASRESLR